ncbi:phospho-sugar mutase [Paenarthrobacter sp. PH39-S1]|uniref:phospho-sugar mutase n=1 Tax=Paenarthrobacter sp. PH39-S1 TaxID=3046204 RepID=UPI0024B8FA11|nr:phospho-sugar mutase [Paenarthrobacter sp. PH39-S1]MDJ0356089.1 phospho-sugar mutase [Paenarthrobacter sp. PH39-S1]
MTLPDTELQPLLHAARAWADQDPDPVTAAQLRALMVCAGGADAGGTDAGGADAGGAQAGGADAEAARQEAAQQELADSFSGNLQFGTAGLRAAMGPGPNRMNRVVVRRAAAGLAAFLLKRASTDPAAASKGQDSTTTDSTLTRSTVPATPATPPTTATPVTPATTTIHATTDRTPSYTPRAVVGFDARHNSDIFATESAAIFTAAGIETFLLPCALPTPLLAYAVRALDCDGGVMVTASHNHAQDNGYKVYLGGRTVTDAGQGAQIVAPFDELIAAEIAAIGPLASIELADSGWTVVDAGFTTGYQGEVRSLADSKAFPARDLKIVYTPMHGVGGMTAVEVLNGAGFEDISVVAAQALPDPDFPTVAFPNPEEPGALDLALELARESGADIVLANDPDADRAAVAALDPATGSWRMLRGDEVGALLGAHIAARLSTGHSVSNQADDGGTRAGGSGAGDSRAGGSGADDSGAGGWPVTAGVDSNVGADFATPVFANSIVSSRLLARISAAHGLAHTETLTGFKWISRVPGLVYGYEEALGYCIAPKLVRDKDGISAALLIAELAAEEKARGRTIFDTLDDLALEHGLHAGDQLSLRVPDLAQLATMMTALRREPPAQLGGSAVEHLIDLAQGSDALPPTDGLLFLTADGRRVIIRPSGTEPKLKCYLEVIIAVDAAADLPEARRRARSALDSTLADLRGILAP